MKANEMKCALCGSDAWQAAQRGAYLRRTSPKGTNWEGRCAPSCEECGGGAREAVLRAIVTQVEAGNERLF